MAYCILCLVEYKINDEITYYILLSFKHRIRYVIQPLHIWSYGFYKS